MVNVRLPLRITKMESLMIPLIDDVVCLMKQKCKHALSEKRMTLLGSPS
jgi:hypothetical protein